MRLADVQCLAGGLITGMTQAGMTKSLGGAGPGVQAGDSRMQGGDTQAC